MNEKVKDKVVGWGCRKCGYKFLYEPIVDTCSTLHHPDDPYMITDDGVYSKKE